MSTNNIVIIPSAVSPTMGIFSAEERFEQTKITISTVRDFIPNSIIIMNDISLRPAPKLKEELAKLVDVFIDSDQDERAQFYSKNHLKSHGELALFCKALAYIKDNFNVKNINRIFKLGGRCYLRESFNIIEHNNANKLYVFKSVTSWMNSNMFQYVTTFWSMDSCLIDNYLENENKLLDLLNSGYDAEHVHKMCFKENTKEISILHCGHLLGPNGMLIDD